MPGSWHHRPLWLDTDPWGSWRAPRATPGDGSRRLPGRIGRRQRPPLTARRSWPPPGRPSP